MMRGVVRYVIAVVAIGVLFGGAGASADSRLALVIGNGDYTHAPLANPVNDARDVAAKLRKLGFEVMLVTDAHPSDLEDKVSEFGRRIPKNGVGLFYYAGHGVQINGDNYLIPTGANLSDAVLVKNKAFKAQIVLDYMAQAGAAVNIVILDACRDNPFPGAGRSLQRGLARVESGNSVLVAYAAKPGATADDGGDERNSPYTRQLLAYLDRPGLRVQDLFNDMSLAVKHATDGKQVPEFTATGLEPYCLAGCQTAVVDPPPADPTPPPRQRPDPAPAPSRTLKTGDIIRDRLKSGGEGPAMVYIEGGSFAMGSPEGETGRQANERQHSVSVDAFYLMQHEVTVGEFKRFVNARRYPTDAERDVGSPGCGLWDEATGKWAFTAGRSWRSPGFAQTDAHPVVCISYNDAKAYADWLSGETGRTYRLPTEAEWEYAARAGTATARFWGDSEASACRYANVADQSKLPSGVAFSPNFPCSDGYFFPAPVGSFAASGWNLKDMLGNVWEWTCSAYDENYGGSERRCAGSAEKYAVRGGGWFNVPARVRSAGRGGNAPADRGSVQGFRLSRTL